MADKEKLALQQVWKACAARNEPIEIPCVSESEAVKLRFALYNAVKRVKKYPMEDETLTSAVDSCSLSFKDGNRKVLVVRPKAMSGLVMAVEAALGIKAQELRPQVDIDAEESLRRFKEMQVADERPANPYYKKD